MRVFLSSTHVDLISYRRAATEALERLGQQVGRMEVFGARPEEPVEACLQEIGDCDLFVGVYAHRYGYIPSDAAVSITELEFRHASAAGKPRFCFVVDEDHPWPPKMVEADPGRSKLVAFKGALTDVVNESFTTPEDLAFKIATSIGRYFTQRADSAAGNTHRPPTVVFEARPSYPRLEFSVVNTGSTPIQLTALRVVKAASIKAEYDPERFLLGSRLQLEFDLHSAAEGEWTSALSGRVSNLAANEVEAFVLDLSAENTLNLVDIELEYVSSAMPRAMVVRPPEIIFVSAPYSSRGWAGSIQLLTRSEALSALLNEVPMPLHGPIAESHPHDVSMLLLRGAAHLCFDDIAQGWTRMYDKVGESTAFGPVAASFAELGRDRDLPLAVREALESWVNDPGAVRNAPIWDDESHALIVQEFLIEGLQSQRGTPDSEVPQDVAKWLSMLDSTLAIAQPPDNDDRSEGEAITALLGEVTLQSNRTALLRRLIDRYGEGAVEYLVVNLRLASLSTSEIARLLASALGREAAFSADVNAIQEEWREWWDRHRDIPSYSNMRWRPYSPRLAKAGAALFATTRQEVPAERDGLVGLALARNPCTIETFAMDLTRAPEVYIRMELAMSQRTPPSVLATLAQDPSSLVRRWVASNPQTDDATLTKLGQDESEKVRAFLSQNPRTSERDVR